MPVKLYILKDLNTAEKIIVRLFDSQVISAGFCKQILNRMMRLTTAACDEFDKLVEELNEEVIRR